ncbi:GAF domain-containing sensor histidine kinase [Granulicella arctica]|uniref:histidine kinase n=1 Tax=Granulicella arctica TaxID=940613 RepID=A0A7Y9PED1_9BACT|nr:GAF domain-containing sensor histidine kinase [Granulicella arctica]NYF78361.1 signal transduction histidine kinase [Granulicella arctica]
MQPDRTHPVLPGVDIHNAADDVGFASRTIRARNIQAERNAYLRIAHMFTSPTDELLQELVNLSISLCGAESAGISLLEGENFRWIATGGRFAPLRDSMLPETAAPCSICLKRNTPQIFSVGHAYYDFLEITGPTFTNGLLIPWHTPEIPGTLWVIPYKNSPGFDNEDLRLLESLADMASLYVRMRDQQQRLHDRDLLANRALLANHLAHQINNPLQSLTNALYLASQQNSDSYLVMALAELQRLSSLIEQLLKLPQVDPS